MGWNSRSRPVESGLGRDRDKEFLNGSGITLEELEPAQEENLYKLAKVWGFVKYYHPHIIAGEINWDAELFRVMPRVFWGRDLCAYLAGLSQQEDYPRYEEKIVLLINEFTQSRGETIQRVGVQPDIFCRPTAEALRQGRDELLEEAVRQILAPQP